MIKTIFVTATGTNVGKTYTALKIMELLAAKGLRAAPFKPIETGVDGAPVDALTLLDKHKKLYQDDTLTIDDICPYKFALPAAPYVANGGQTIDISAIKHKLQLLKQKYDVVIVEGAGGLFVPINADYFMIDLAKELCDFVVLVSHTGLGCINDALLSRQALQNAQIPHELIFNRRENDNFDSVSKPFLKEYLSELCEFDDFESVLESVLRQ